MLEAAFGALDQVFLIGGILEPFTLSVDIECVDLECALILIKLIDRKH